MSTIFDTLFTDAKQSQRLVPSIPIVDCSFILASFEPYHEWDAENKRFKPEMVTDESGERLRCTVGLVLSDAHGHATTMAAPIRDQSHFFTVDEVKKLQGLVGKSIKLVSPRIECVDAAKKNEKTGFARVETKFTLAFDGVEV